MADLTCDVAIIGAGTAGLAAERNARAHGAKTLLIDPEFAGTVCATVGCMPSKLLIAAAKSAHAARNSHTFGIRTEGVTVDGPAVMQRVQNLRDDFASHTRDSFADLPDGTCIKARARFTGPDELALDDGRTVKAKAVIIATGSEPMIPEPYRDLGDLVLTNRTIFELDDLPESLAVIGGGAIGVELAQAMARLGVRVALYDRETTLAAMRDQTVQRAIQNALSQDLTLHLGTDPEPSSHDGKVRLAIEGQTDTFDRVLLAAGRPPQLDGLDLEATGLTLNDNGLPEVDPTTMQCGDAPIFMAGDINGMRPVLHEASLEGAAAGRNAVAYPAVVRTGRRVPFSITFTDPPVVSIGHPAEDEGHIGASDYSDQGRARVEARNIGLLRLYASAPDGRITGASLFCPGAEHLGHLLAWAIETGATASELLDDRPYYHPTLEEGIRSALRDICKALHIPVPGNRDIGDPPGI